MGSGPAKDHHRKHGKAVTADTEARKTEGHPALTEVLEAATTGAPTTSDLLHRRQASEDQTGATVQTGAMAASQHHLQMADTHSHPYPATAQMVATVVDIHIQLQLQPATRTFPATAQKALAAPVNQMTTDHAAAPVTLETHAKAILRSDLTGTAHIATAAPISQERGAMAGHGRAVQTAGVIGCEMVGKGIQISTGRGDRVFLIPHWIQDRDRDRDLTRLTFTFAAVTTRRLSTSRPNQRLDYSLASDYYGERLLRLGQKGSGSMSSVRHGALMVVFQSIIFFLTWAAGALSCLYFFSFPFIEGWECEGKLTDTM